jgi:hypothetical protein
VGLSFSQEKLFGYPLKSGAISFGKINAQNAQAFFLLNNSSLLSGAIAYQTVTVTLETLPLSKVPFEKPSLANFGTQVFQFRGKSWTVLEVTFSGIYNIGSEPCYRTYTLVAVDTSAPEFTVA